MTHSPADHPRTGPEPRGVGHCRRSTSPGWAPLAWAVFFTAVGCVASAEPTLALPDPRLAPGPASFAPGDPEELLAVARSGSFRLTFPNREWYAVDPRNHPRLGKLDLAVYHAGGRAWVKGRLARRSNRGVEGALIDEAAEAKYLVAYDPDTVETKVSLEDYRGSALYCGRLRQGNANRACSLVVVALHGRQMIRLHSLVDAKTTRQRERLLAEVEAAFASLELLPAPPDTEDHNPPKAAPDGIPERPGER